VVTSANSCPQTGRLSYKSERPRAIDSDDVHRGVVVPDETAGDVRRVDIVVAAFLFIITSVVSAAYVLAMFSLGGDLNPSTKVKLAWGAVLGALGLVMILSDSVDAVKSIIALGAMPFVFIVLLLTVCLLKALKRETG